MHKLHPGNRQTDTFPVKITENYHTCTCLFPDNRIAIVHVQGAVNQKEARAHVRSAWYPYQYEVYDGDLSHGRIEPFYLRLRGMEPLWLPTNVARGIQSIRRVS